MTLEHLTLSNVRSYASLEFEPHRGVNLVIGANAQGKSNLLEAIAMLGTGKSFRTTRDGELIRTGTPLATIAGAARVAAGSLHLACTIAATATGARKRYTINGEGVRYAGFLGSVKVVTFVPGDLALVSGGPALRRSFLNEALAIASPRYYREYARYRRALEQKNALLRGAISPDPELLAIYDAALVESGTAVMLARRHYLAQLSEVAAAVQARWVGAHEPLEVRYLPNVPIEVATGDGVAAAFTERLAERRAAETARRVSLVGPHRDEVTLAIGGSALAVFGSQGQQRTAVLALKVAEAAVVRDRSGEAPILLLDDVLSELDAERAAAFLGALDGVEQTFITATERPPALAAAPAFRVVLGAVHAC